MHIYLKPAVGEYAANRSCNMLFLCVEKDHYDQQCPKQIYMSVLSNSMSSTI
jgi:hypothetical protein